MTFDQADPRVGDRPGVASRSATAVDLFRFSAATWNAHRIHFDPEWARAEGLPGPVVQAHLHGAWLAQVAREVGGPAARLTRLSWSNRAPVIAGQVVAIEPIVSEVSNNEATRSLTLELTERDADGATCVTGSATIQLGALS